MENLAWALAVKGLIFSLIVFAFYKIIPAGRIKTALFRERPWTIPSWLVGMLLFIVVFGIAAYRIIAAPTGQ
jgi:hypothetical protein